MTDVLVEVDDLVAVVTLNRPERRNAISGKLLAGLREALADLDARADVRAIVLTGADPALSQVSFGCLRCSNSTSRAAS